jgi:hypothetical protein
MSTDSTPRVSLSYDSVSLSDPRTAVASVAASISGKKLDNEFSLDVEKNAHVPGDIISQAEYTFPDGGLEAWSVVAGGWLVLFATFGYVNGEHKANIVD